MVFEQQRMISITLCKKELFDFRAMFEHLKEVVWVSYKRRSIDK